MSTYKKEIQTVLPGVEEQQRKDMNIKIQDQKDILFNSIDTLINTRSPEAQRNTIINLKQLNGAIEAMVKKESFSNGLGTIIITRTTHKVNERIVVKYIAIKPIVSDDGLPDTEKKEKTVMTHLFNPIDWDVVDSEYSSDNSLYDEKRHKAILEEQQIKDDAAQSENIPMALKEAVYG